MLEHTFGGTELATFDDPGVRIHCWYTDDIPTPAEYVYDLDNLVQPLRQTYVGGDDTCDAASLSVCERWARAEVRVHSGIEHGG